MFVLVGKVLGPLLAPLGLATALWVAAAWFRLRRGGRGSWPLMALGAAVLAVSSSPLVGEAMLGHLEADFPVLAVAECPQVDAIVVLGGMTDPPLPPRREVEVGASFDRMLQAMRLLQAAKAPWLVFSGGNIPELSGSASTEAGQMRELAVLCGVPAACILLEDSSRTTRENALFTARLLRERGLNRVLLVTSAGHMRRAMGVFRHEGVQALAVPADVHVVERPYRWAQLLPTLWGLECSTWATKEYLGYWVYRWRGWID